MAVSAPQNVLITPEIFFNSSITITWNTPATATGTISGYVVYLAVSEDNGATWSQYVQQGTTTASVRSFSTVPDAYVGTLVRAGITAKMGNETSAMGISNTAKCDITPATPPTSCSLNSELSGANVILSWAGAGSSSGRISGYPVQYSDSPDNAAWGDWVDLTFVSAYSSEYSLSVMPPPTYGDYRRFRVRTEPTFGETYSSDWKISSNSVRRSIPPTMPTVFTAEPQFYTTSTITIKWSGIVVGTSPISQIVIQQSTAPDGVQWSAFQTINTINTSTGNGTYIAAASTVSGMCTRYSISVRDTLNNPSNTRISNTVKRHTLPLAPSVVLPKAGAVTYNKRPMLLIETKPEPDGDNQSVSVRVDGNSWRNSITDPACFTTPGATPKAVKTVYTEPVDVAPGQVVAEVFCKDSYAAGASVTRAFTVEASPFEDITANLTHVKASHILTLRAAINTVRNYYGMEAYIWNSEIFSGFTQVRDWPFHVLELQAAVQGVVDKINTYDEAAGEYAVPPLVWIDMGHGRPRADVMNQLMALVLKL